MLEKEQWAPNNSRFEWNGDIVFEERRMKLFWNLRPNLESVSELKVALENIIGHFPQVQLTKMYKF